MSYFSILLSLFLATAPGNADSAAADKDRLHGEVTRLLTELASDRFDVRRNAAEQIEKMAAKPELKQGLATEFQRVLVQTDISFEVRLQVERWSRQLPPPPAEPVPDVSPKELDDLLRRLDDDSYAVRIGTASRLDWLLGNPKMICPIMLRLKSRLADESLSGDARDRIETMWERARGAWLASDMADNELPAVSNEQIDRWLDDFMRTASADAIADKTTASNRTRDMAEYELLDLLARDDYLPKLKQAIQSRLAKKPKADAAAKLNSLLDRTKPELVVEYWHGRTLSNEQSLIVGVPTKAPNAPKPTCFDRVDDHVAHCASGNSLVPGDYPLGEAVSHPRQEGAFFHLVSLPTPRRRMAYASGENGNMAKRLAELSRRTLDHALADKRTFSEQDLLMLAQLDPAELSRFAGKYFLQVDDSPLTQSGPPRLGGRPSRFGLICGRLAIDGRNGAMPGLIEAIAKNRFLPPRLQAPYRLDLLAALSIASRDPWPEVDVWLAGCLDRSELLMEGNASAAECGATAAALLLKRHGQSSADFGLTPAADSQMKNMHVNGYRFANKDAREKVRKWWLGEKNRKKP